MFLAILFLCIVFKSTAVAQVTNVTLPLNKTLTLYDKELNGDFFFLNQNATLHMDFKDVNPNVTFIIFQVHSHIYNVTVYKHDLLNTTALKGTNVGFYSHVKPLSTFSIVNSNKNVRLKLYVSVHGYGKFDPIPGGCSLEISPVYPVIQVREFNGYRFVDIAPPKSVFDDKCMNVNDGSTIVVYRVLYLPEWNFEADVYFEGIKSMMTLTGFKNLKKIPAKKKLNRKIISAYPGTGAIYGVIVRDLHLNYSFYIPTYTYGCSPLDNGCELLDDFMSQLVCTLLLFFGIFICYFGHKFFKTEMFFMGLITGVTLTYIVISLMADLDRTGLVAASVISGLFFGAIWLLFWWLYAIPFISVMLPSLNLGFLWASVFYYAADGDRLLNTLEDNFLVIFVFIVLLTALVLVPITFHANIVCCGVLGGYAAVYTIDYYLGSNLKYIVINVLRRSTIKVFKTAVVIPPFQWREGLVIALWVLMSVTGIAYQYYTSRGKPPFPPAPRSTRPEPPNYGTITRPIRRVSNAVQAIVTESTRATDESAPLLRT